MNKAILISINPKYMAKILNGEKTIEVRKRFPGDYVGWVYIYVTKDSKKGWCMVGINGNETYYQKYDRNAMYSVAHNYIGNGKVVARFWCDKVKVIEPQYDTSSYYYKDFIGMGTDELCQSDLCKESCLEEYELEAYLEGEKGRAIHIQKIEIFDKPKDISEFENRTLTKPRNINPCVLSNGYFVRPLTRAPQSWCYIEI